LRNGNILDIPVYKFDDLPFEGEQYSGCGHDENEHTGANASRQMKPENSFTKHDPLCLEDSLSGSSEICLKNSFRRSNEQVNLLQ
jgi:hypothetical protein